MSLTKFRVAYIPEHFSTPLMFAEKHGFYKKRGLEIEFVEVIEGSGRLIKLLNTNEVDIAIGLTEAFVADIAKGNNAYKLIDTYVKSPLLWAISTGSKRDELTNAQQLDGRAIGVSRIGSGSYVMSFVLAHSLKFAHEFSSFPILSNFQNLRDSANLKFGSESELKNSDAFMWEYFTSKKYYDNGEIKQIGEIYTPWPSWVINATNNVYTSNKKAVSDFLAAVNEGIAYFNGNVDEAIEHIGTNLDYSKEDAQEWSKTVQFNDKLGEAELDWESVVGKTSAILKVAGVLSDSDEVIAQRLEGGVVRHNCKVQT